MYIERTNDGSIERARVIDERTYDRTNERAKERTNEQTNKMNKRTE